MPLPAHCGMTGIHCQLGWFLQMEGYLECGVESEQLSHQGLFAEGFFFMRFNTIYRKL